MKLRLLPFIIAFGFFSGCAVFRLERGLRSSAQDWVTMGGAPSRANRSPAIILPPLDEQWQYSTVAGVSATPLVRDSLIILGTLNGEVQVINFSSGKRLTYVNLDGPVVGTPAWDKMSVVVPLSTSKESLVSLDLNGMQRSWGVVLGAIESSPLIYEDQILVTTLDGNAFSLRRADGTEMWKFRTGTRDAQKPIRSSPACDENLVFFGSDDGFLYAVSRKEGSLQWKYRCGASIFASPVVSDNRVVVGSIDGSLHCLEAGSGRKIWSFETGSKIYASVSTNGKLVFLCSADGTCYGLDAVTGSKIWATNATSVISCAPLVSGEVVYIGSLDNNLYAVDAATGRSLWQYTAPGRIRVSPVVWGNMLILTSEDKYLTALATSRKAD